MWLQRSVAAVALTALVTWSAGTASATAGQGKPVKLLSAKLLCAVSGGLKQIAARSKAVIEALTKANAPVAWNEVLEEESDARRKAREEVMRALQCSGDEMAREGMGNAEGGRGTPGREQRVDARGSGDAALEKEHEARQQLAHQSTIPTLKLQATALATWAERGATLTAEHIDSFVKKLATHRQAATVTCLATASNHQLAHDADTMFATSSPNTNVSGCVEKTKGTLDQTRWDRVVEEGTAMHART
ncbi:hypothetical protein ERJ75_000520700 [Trypanosoma vivax]|nr:hypothetical protein ERJ75_000520700 [Trypanosoma vivax]